MRGAFVLSLKTTEEGHIVSFLYAVTIYPLQLAYTALFTFLSNITCDYGIGLLCLSLVSSVLFVPLKQLASSLQARETAIQKVMAPQLAAIKAQSRGAEQQARIRALYHRYAYNPLLSLRSSFGILMQVPFLYAAYNMISEYTPLYGQGWWIITDLGKPDNILGGINLLPILMTLFNLGALFTASGFSRKDHVQGVVVAGLFLLLLYTAPSALLVYWTGNNALMLLENLVPRLIPQTIKKYLKKSTLVRHWKDETQHFAFVAEPPSVSGFLRFAAVICGIPVFAFICCILLRKYGFYFYRQQGLEFLPAIISTGMFLIVVCAMIWKVMRTSVPVRIKIIKYIIIADAACVVGYFLFSLIYYGNANAFEKLLNRLYYGLTISLVILFCVNCLSLLSSLKKYFLVKDELLLFASSILLAGFVVFIFSPFTLYLSSPDFFRVPVREIFVELLPYLLLFFMGAVLVRWLLPKFVYPYTTFFVVASTIIVLLNSTLLTGNYGSIDGFILSGKSNLSNPNILYYDLVIIFLTFLILSVFYYFRQTKQLVIVLQASTVFICLTSAATFFKADDTKKPLVEQRGFITNNLFAFSKTEPNVVIFFLDMFTGGHIQEILAEKPDMEKKLTGFTWYPDTVSVGDMTSLSSPSIFGGPDFLVDIMNEDSTRTLNEKFTQALALLPGNFGEHGYLLSFVNPLYDLDMRVFEKYSGGHSMEFLGREDLGVLTHHWSKKIGVGFDEHSPARLNFSSLMLSIALFKAVPHALKPKVYNNGNWRFGTVQNVFGANFAETLYQSALLGLLSSSVNTHAAGPTFKVFYSMLPHSTWHLPKDGLIPVEDPYPETQGQFYLVDGIIPEHFYAEVHIMDMLTDFFDKLRQQNVFNNTMILLVSDHCNADSRMLNTALGFDPWGKITGFGDRATTLFPGRPHALMMVKPLNADAPFQISNALMTTADVPALVCQVLGGCPGITFPYTGPDRERFHFFGADWRQIEVKGKKLYDPYKKAIIRGSMFKKENWIVPD
jgi:membrane protein insertase Oxa1/YidC/SpoIIIJ